jgi:N-acetylmuramoyl-L-alanine amidase
LTGLETYYLDNTDDQASRKLAERENGVTSGGDLDDLSFIVSDLIQSGKLEDSILLSRVVDGSLRARALRFYPEGRSLGVKKAPFFVLVGAHMPCSLIELFFIDNPQDARQLADSDFRDTLARALADGIARFLDGVPSRPSSEGTVTRATAGITTRNQSAGES